MEDKELKLENTVEEEKHHHHHDEECECGCEHEHHHHHHHHDEECECGCEHEHHHHHHDEECECGCEHEHHHHHHHDEECECHDPNCTDPSHHHHHDGPISISHHETSIIGAVKGVMKESDFEKGEALLSEAMKECGRLVNEAGGIIGHIKFVLTGPGRCSQISVTEAEENIRRFDGNTASVEGVAIVFFVEDEVLTEILQKTICTLLEEE